MTPEIRKSLQVLLDSSDAQKEDYGREGYFLLTMYLSQVGIKNKEFDDFILDVAKLVTSAGKESNERERLYFAHVTNEVYREDVFREKMSGGMEPHFVRKIFHKIRQLDKYPIEYLLQFVAGLMACDDEIGTKELRLYDALLRIHDEKED
jgi:hypothetical protein